MAASPEGQLSYEMRYRATWLTYLARVAFAGGGAFVIVVGGVRGYPVTIPFTVFGAVVGVVGHLRSTGRLLLRADGRGIQLGESRDLFVAWPDVLVADIGYSGDDRALVFRVVRGSAVPLSARGERAARRVNRPAGGWGRSAPHADLTVSYLDMLDRAALTAVIRAHAPHVTGRFGAG